jgi:putative cardiolipin synthase
LQQAADACQNAGLRRLVGSHLNLLVRDGSGHAIEGLTRARAGTSTPMITAHLRVWWALAASVIAMAAGGCASLPPLEGREATSAMTDTADTRLGRSAQAEAAAHPGKSGIYALERPQDAFVARVVLTRAAERSLDVQYYIWHGDTTGYLMFEELWNAAERGVRVRLLLDDNGVAGLDPTIAALDSHPHIEVRLFNPFANRSMRLLGYLTDFDRLNRRMHNKSFTADSQVTIVGGRNIGDEYFGAGPHMVFADLDVVGIGPVAGDVAQAFDLYWNSESAYPAQGIIGQPKADAVSVMQARFAQVRASPAAIEYGQALQATRLVEQLVAQELPLVWAPVELVYDEPTKTLGKAQASELLLTRMNQALGPAQRQVDIISPYFVPGKQGTRVLSAYPQRGVQLRILTNSLAATDVGAVHAGYAKRRAPLLRGGAKLYELKPDARLAAGTPRSDGSRRTGSSSASLHAKTFSVDRHRVFVGSFNLDPRSVALNTEIGVVIESPELAAAVSDGLDSNAERRAYEVRLAPDGHGLEWIERTAQGEVRYDTEPKTSWFKRFGVKLMSWLPIEWLL